MDAHQEQGKPHGLGVTPHSRISPRMWQFRPKSSLLRELLLVPAATKHRPWSYDVQVSGKVLSPSLCK